MSPEVSERAFEAAIECGLLEYGPDACAGDGTTVRELQPAFGAIGLRRQLSAKS